MKNEQWSESDAPLVPPDAKFRQDLSRALQDTHQRQRVQRQLYGNGRRSRTSGLSLASVAAALSLLALVFGLGYYFGRRNR